jgi:phosphoribosylformylglycinamidine cyclo-ligase
MNKINYKDSGVNIDAGNNFVDKIKPYVNAAMTKNVLGGIGSFAGAFELPIGYKQPVILGATDGVGTKLKLAIDSKRFDTVGIDLVAMCVNDLICNFAKPMFFLDYYATSKLNIKEASAVIKGISKGCQISNIALIGGETAEMPGMYKDGDFDLAGFATGIAEKEDIVNSNKTKVGDILIALPSSGIHSNGYSLVRKLFFETLSHNFDDKFDNKDLIDVLLEPTRIYVDEYEKFKPYLNALAHITGGGITENLPRVLKDGLRAKIKLKNIKVLPIFEYMLNHVELNEMYRTFNMGVGMIYVVDKKNVDYILQNSDGYIIGEIIKGDIGVEYDVK